LLNSSPYYAQANGQAEASNKTIEGLIKKKIEEKPRKWHEVLMEVLWACRVSKHGATKVMPFELVYGQEAMLLLMTKFSKSEKTGLSSLLFWNIRFWQFQSEAKEEAKFKDLKI
jgi:hypothetical protein